MAKILITGGTGLVGKSISKKLLELNHEPVWLSRKASQAGKIKSFSWSPKNNKLDAAVFENVDHIIHLAGAGIVDRTWTKKYKQIIIDSRIKSSELLANTMIKNNIRIKSFTGASAIGYYGTKQDEKNFTEDLPPGNDFLSSVCSQWEKSYEPFNALAERKTIVRLGVVLDKKEGAFPKLIKTSKFGIAITFGDGKQHFPWIHIEDAANIFIETLLNQNYLGIYNAVATELITNDQFANRLTKKLHKHFLRFKVPEALLQIALGERALTLTKGVRINNHKIKAAGFQFKYDDLNSALDNLLVQTKEVY